MEAKRSFPEKSEREARQRHVIGPSSYSVYRSEEEGFLTRVGRPWPNREFFKHDLFHAVIMREVGRLYAL